MNVALPRLFLKLLYFSFKPFTCTKESYNLCPFPGLQSSYIYIWIWIVFHSLNGVYLVFLTLVYSLLSPLCVILVLRQHMQVSHGFELLPTIYYMAWKSFTTENSMAST